jgi:predicted TIM-barrel fold metal-dependent hydrolase
MNRRTFIKNAALVAAAAAAGHDRATAQVAGPTGNQIPSPRGNESDLVDSNVYLSRWPFRRLPCDETPRLARLLRENGVSRAWAGSFDALLHRDISAVNSRLADECRAEGTGLFSPFGSVNPLLPDWEEDLRRCHEVHGMRGIRLHPDFHGYSLDDSRFARLADLAAARGLVIQIALGIEDPRTQPPTAIYPSPHPGPLVELLPRIPNAKVVLLNFFRSFGYNRVLLVRLANLPQVSFDMATVEGVDAVRGVLESVGSIRLLFGSLAPYYNFDSARLKMQESELSPQQIAAIRHGHATSLLSS